MDPKPLKPSDYSQVAKFHSDMGFDYKLDLESPLFVIKHGVYDENGRLLGAGALRLQAEAYLWLDTSLSNRVRLELVYALSRSLAVEAWRAGLDCVVAYLPPNIPKSFKRLLKRLNWLPDRDGWQNWSRYL